MIYITVTCLLMYVPTSCKNKCTRLKLLHSDYASDMGNTRTKIPGSLICRYCEVKYIPEGPLTDIIKKNRCPCCSQKMALIHQPEILVSRI